MKGGSVPGAACEPPVLGPPPRHNLSTAAAHKTASVAGAPVSGAPGCAGLVLVALILVTAVANLYLSVSGLLLELFYWGSMSLIMLPLAEVAIFMAWRFVPAHVNEGTERVDKLGGVHSLALAR